MKFSSILLSVVVVSIVTPAQGAFQRVGTFFPCQQIDPKCNTSIATGAEIVTASTDGNTLIYSDTDYSRIGFVNIVDPTKPLPAGTVDFAPGQPNSVAVTGNYVLVAINTSPNLANPTGYIAVVDITTRAIVRNITVPGQPDAVTCSPLGITVVSIENERNETLNGGAMPQLPPGSVFWMNTSSTNPAAWTTLNINVTNLPNLNFPTDPEPELAAINSQGTIVVTLQENNGLVLINGTTGAIINSFSAGTVNLTEIDTTRVSTANGNVILQNQARLDWERQPDGVAWIDNTYFVTADEGDIGNGGTRTFTIFDSRTGAVVFDIGSKLEQYTVRIGHYNDRRSNSKGIELESVFVATFDGKRLLFVLSERSSVVFVYDLTNPINPVFLQVLACSSIGPEGAVTIPSRNLLAVSNEVDTRATKFRSSISIYRNTPFPPTYPYYESAARTANTFIPFSALSGLAASPGFGDVPAAVTTLYTIDDSFFARNRIFTIEVTSAGPPYKIATEITIKDNSNLLAAALAPFPNTVISARINADKTVNIDPEGISTSKTNPATVWIASEGTNSGSNITLPNLLLRVSLADGNIVSAITLPPAVNALATTNGFEGCAEYGNYVVVTFQREWLTETRVRLGLYNYVTSSWKFVYYQLDAYTSPLAGGWVGLSDITSIGGGKFLILERDNNGGLDATIKRLYEIDLGSDLALVAENITVTKSLKLDMLGILSTTWGHIPEKVEGVTIDANGNVWVNNDNDGVEGTAGEQQLNFMGPLYAADKPSQSPSASPIKAPVPVPVVAPIPVKAPTSAPVRPPTNAPVRPPTKRPTKRPTKAPTKTPTKVPTIAPTEAPIRRCGLLRLAIFCPLSGEGFFSDIWQSIFGPR